METNIAILVSFASFGAVVVGITEVVKRTFKLSSRYIPLTSVMISVIMLALAANLGSIVFSWDTLLEALIVGLMACGLWSASKTTFGK